MRSTNKGPTNKRILEIASTVGEYYGYDARVLSGASRLKSVITARNISYVLAARDGFSTTEIGEQFNRDHSTVLIAIRRTKKDKKLAKLINTLENRINKRGEA